MQTIRIDGIHGAEYNPRFLSDDSFEMLKKSIRELGIIKPVIVRLENRTIIAGHQRTKAMTALGITETPAYVLKNLNYADEVRFNQLHNACELEVSPKAPKMRITATLKVGEFQRVKNSQIKVEALGSLNSLTNVLAKLLIKYGEFGCPICTPDGTVRVSAAYAYAAKITGSDMDVLCLEDAKAMKAAEYLSKQYGVFSYDTLEKKTYQQRYAQKKRLRDGRKGDANSNKSFLYEKYVLPYLQAAPKTIRICDFGAGQKDYYSKLKKAGWDIVAVDPYHMKDGSVDVDIRGNAADFIKIATEIEKRGLFDVVICDSVLNSVDSVEAEQAVINTVYGLCRMGGHIFISGRNLEAEVKRGNTKTIKTEDSLVHFYDKDNFSGIFRNGEWFYQKFHTRDDIKAIAEKMSSDYKVFYNSQAFEISAVKNKTVSLDEVISGLRYEWNLPLPNNMRYGLADTIEKSYRARISND